MEEPVFIKCEPGWIAGTAELNITGPDMKLPLGEQTGVKTEPEDILYNPFIKEELEIQDVKIETYDEKNDASGVSLNGYWEEMSSPSEEEIDIVSVGKKQTRRQSEINRSITRPTNPSARDCQELHLKVASAISAINRQHHPNSIPMCVYIGDKTITVRTVPAESLLGADNKHKSVSSRGPDKGVQRTKYKHRHKPGRRERSRGTSDSEPDSLEKRISHRDMEKQRRIEHRSLVEGLRVLVPEVKDEKRAAKVLILKKATAYCYGLREQYKALISRLSYLQKEQERLRARVSQLRREIAAQRIFIIMK